MIPRQLQTPGRTHVTVGRRREQAALQASLEELRAGRGGLILVSGEAGIGKTTLIEEFRQRAESLGIPVEFGYCFEITATVPYGLWNDLADSMRAPGRAPIPGVHKAKSEPDERHSGHDFRFRQVIGYVDARPVNEPLILILEDLHWADWASLDLLRAVARRTRSMQLLIVVTYRSDELTSRHPLFQVLPSLIREAKAERISLPRLDRKAVDQYVALHCGLEEDERARLAGYLHDHSEGNPLFLNELLRTLFDEGVLTVTGDRWRLGGLDRIVIPPLVHQLIQNRLDQLSDATHRSLEIGAAIGQFVPYDLWRAVLQLDDESLTPIIREAIDSGFIVQSGVGPDLEFSNALVRDALYDQLLIPERRILHHEVADALLRSAQPDPDVVATHLLHAHDDRAVDWLVKAGERAQRSYALRMAAERFQTALRLMDRSTSSSEHAWFVYRTARLLRFADPVSGIEYLDQAANEAAAVGDRVLEGYAVADRGMMRCFVGDMRRGMADIEKGVEILTQLADDGVRLDRDVALWITDALTEDERLAIGSVIRDDAGYLIMPRWGAFVSWMARSGRFREARKMGELLLDQHAAGTRTDVTRIAVSAISLALGITYAHMCMPEQARQAFARARANVTDVLVGQFAIMELVQLQLRFDADNLEARRSLAAVAESAWSRAADARPSGVPIRYASSHLRLVEGDWDEALWLARLEASHDIGMNHPHATTVLATLALWTGDYVAAENRIRETFPQGAETEPGDCEFSAALDLQCIAIELQLARNDLTGARSWLEAQERWLDWSGATSHLPSAQILWACYHRQAGRLDNARKHVDTAIELASNPRQPLVLLQAHRLLGEILTEQGNVQVAARHLEIALQLSTSCKAVFERALTLLAIARLKVRSNEYESARPVVSDARDILSRLNAQPSLTEAEKLTARIAERLGISTHEAPPEPQSTLPAGLTKREAEVLRLIAAGISNRAIASSLNLSIRTVERHVSNIYFKIDAHNRVDATAFAIRSNLY